MKNKLIALALISASALTLAPKPAAASNEGLAVLGGIIGGVIVASAINNIGYDAYPVHHTGVVVSGRGDSCDQGYWHEATVKVWVPGCWVVERGYHGNGHRHYVDGHYEYRTNRVWVANDRHGRHGRDVSYGYGHR